MKKTYEITARQYTGGCDECTFAFSLVDADITRVVDTRCSSGSWLAFPSEYAITTVDDDLGIPVIPRTNWPTYNSFRAAPPIGVNPDAVGVFKEACTLECDRGRLRLVALVGNIGTTALPPGVPMTVYAERDGGWVSLETQVTTESVPSGQTSSGLVFDLNPDDIPEGTIQLVVDDEWVASSFAECRLANNKLVISEGLCP